MSRHSALIGTYNHVFIDSVKHVDVFSSHPFSHNSRLRGDISIESLHALFLVAAVVGGVVWYALHHATRNRPEPAQ